jgi:uncharacterized alkaline shock family protein YloU
LKPPIEALPQIAQERAMMSSNGVIQHDAGPVGPERGGMIPRTSAAPDGWPAAPDEDPPTVPDEPIPGRALATRRAVMDIVRAATLGSYGVAGFSGGPIEQVTAWLEGRPPGLRVATGAAELAVRLDLRVAHGVPVAEVARQVDSAIRYGIRRALGREVDRLEIRVRGLVAPVGTPPQPRRHGPGPASSDLADSGSDVA